jgi:ABC-type transport system involved in multi-copper enzyme maturation permease subunit
VNSRPVRNSGRGRIMALAGHEYRAAVRSRILVVLAAILMVITTVSVYISSVEYRSQQADYFAYKAAAQAGGLTTIAPSPLAPLALLRGSIEYLEIIGAIIAIALGYLSISRERSNRTLPLLQSRPVTSGELATGTALGALGLFTTLAAATAFVAVLCVGFIGHHWVNAMEAFKLLLAFVSAIVYLGIFYCIGAVLTARSKVSANGLMVALGLWLAIVLVVPQIGDTLDADNQVPGGLFKALTLDRAGETAVLKHFAAYEKTRTTTEEVSIAKHYERFAFAMTDVKEKYRGFSLPRLLGEKRNDIGWLALYALACAALLRRAYRRLTTTTPGGTQ